MAEDTAPIKKKTGEANRVMSATNVKEGYFRISDFRGEGGFGC